MGQGDAPDRRLRRDRRTGGHQRHQRDGVRAAQRLADGRPRRTCAAGALGPGLAAGDRSPALRRAADALGSHRWRHRRDPGAGRRDLRRRGRTAVGAGVRGLPAGRRLHGGRGRRGRPRRGPRPSRAAGRRGHRARDRAAARRAAAGGHGRHRALLGPRRGRPACAQRGAGHSRLPQRPRPRLPARRSPELLRARTGKGPEGGRRRAPRRRADGLPPRIRGLLRRGHQRRRDRLRAHRPRAPAHARSRALRGHRRDA